MEKKAVSAVVATVLLLLLTVAAVTTLSSIIIPFVKNQLYGSTDCLNYKDYYSFVESIEDINYNCFDSIKNQGVTIKVKPGINDSDETIAGFQISFRGAEDSQVFNEYKNNLQFDVLGDSNHYYPKSGETITYVFSLDKKYDIAEVRAILSNGKICKASDSILIENCKSGVSLQ